jgi:hypothetical protein
MMTIAVSTAQHVSGTHSLAVAFVPVVLADGPRDGSYRIQVSLCGGSGIDLGSKRLRAQIFIDADPANTLPPFVLADTYAAPGAMAAVWNLDVSVPLGAWTSVTTTDPFPPGTVVTNIGFELGIKFGSAPTPGTIYFDDLSVL